MKKTVVAISGLALFSTISFAQDAKQLVDFQFMYKCSSTYSIMSTLKSDKQAVESAQLLAKAYVRTSILRAQTAGISKDKMMQMAQSVDSEMSTWLDQQKAKKIKISDVGLTLDAIADMCTERLKKDQSLAKLFENALQQVKAN